MPVGFKSDTINHQLLPPELIIVFRTTIYLLCTVFVDIDECNKNVDRCEQNCVNAKGTYECSCNTGFILESDGYSCLGNWISLLV